LEGLPHEQCFGSGFTEFESGSRQLLNPDIIQIRIQTDVWRNPSYVFLNPYEGHSRLQEKLQPAENFSNISSFFLFFWDNFGPPGSGSGSTDPFESGSNLDREHCN
jgi:hypothetical protein